VAITDRQIDSEALADDRQINVETTVLVIYKATDDYGLPDVYKERKMNMMCAVIGDYGASRKGQAPRDMFDFNFTKPRHSANAPIRAQERVNAVKLNEMSSEDARELLEALDEAFAEL
jgi:hypothetical protein